MCQGRGIVDAIPDHRDALLQLPGIEPISLIVGKTFTLSIANVDPFGDLLDDTLSITRKQGDINAARFRDTLGLGRKRAIQILEFFDRVGYTRRVRDAHVLRPDSAWRSSLGSAAASQEPTPAPSRANSATSARR